jgi:hypothetical protein
VKSRFRELYVKVVLRNAGGAETPKKTRVLVLDSEDCDQMQGIQNS